jgi:ERCC4-type nuclease
MSEYIKAPDYTIIKDTREKEGYFFIPYQNCLGSVDQKLDTGDYSIVGLEDKICIERKGCVEELAINLGKQKGAFMDEIERMKSFPHKFIVLEFTAEDLVKFPDNTRIPNKNKTDLKITGKYMLKCLMEFQLYNDIHILFCGNKNTAFVVVNSILKRINEKYTIGRKK